VSSPGALEQRAEVERVLEEIGAGAVPQVWVCNKCDLLQDSQRPRQASDWVEVHPGVRRPRVFVSAVTGEGLDALRRVIAAAAAGRLNADAATPPDAVVSSVADNAGLSADS
jgi:GTP-binding protein HflX